MTNRYVVLLEECEGVCHLFFKIWLIIYSLSLSDIMSDLHYCTFMIVCRREKINFNEMMKIVCLDVKKLTNFNILYFL